MRARIVAQRIQLARELQGKEDVKIRVIDTKKVLTDPAMHEGGQRITAREKAERYGRFYKNHLKRSEEHKKLLLNEIVTMPIE